jgi:hypothetical protein
MALHGLAHGVLDDAAVALSAPARISGRPPLSSIALSAVIQTWLSNWFLAGLKVLDLLFTVEGRG